MIFISSTIKDKRFIGENTLTDLFTWIDSAYAVHPNMKGRTGGAMSMGYGIIHAKGNKQKINTKSSTESEFVGFRKYIPYNIWLMLFMEEQGYKIVSYTVYQDNQSTIKMLINRRNSCTVNSRNFDFRYFFVKNRIKNGEFKVEYCPSTKMIANYFTKPLMGERFR